MKAFIKKFLSAIVALVLFFTTSNAQSLASYNSNWINVNAATRNIVSINVVVAGGTATVQAQGACTPTLCDWGVQATTAYAPNVGTNPASVAKGLTSAFSNSFSKIILTAELRGDVLEVTTFTTFTDGSGRFPFMNTENFRRAPATLTAPSMLSPACGATFSNFPRTTKFDWKPVAGAVSYIVEVDCLGCCKAGAWCWDIGKTWKIEKDIKGTTCSYDFTGAQPGRWRVSAVDATGKEGTKSAWCGFVYTK